MLVSGRGISAYAGMQNTGARFEIYISGTPRSYRDDRALVIEGAEFLKAKNPHTEVTVRDLETDEKIVIKVASPAVSMRR